jgi:uncharacterized membrane protein (UPF0127 family)
MTPGSGRRPTGPRSGRLARLGPAALLATALTACAAKAPAEPATRPAPRVVVETSAGARHAVTVELARTPEEQAQGLMWRRSLPADAGMLFVFEQSDRHAFWMRNTLIPLDLIFVGDDGRVVGIVERAEPLTTAPRDPGVPARYVLEVNGGWAAARGVRPGDRIRFEGVVLF